MIKDIRIDWMRDWANDPRLLVLVDRIPDLLEYEFHNPEPGLWYAELGSFVRFFSYSRPGEGYGGSEFKIRTKDGPVSLFGPWSSRSGVFNQRGCGPCVEVTYTDDPKVWDRGYTFFSGAMTVASIQAALPPDIELQCHIKHGEPNYIPSYKGMTPEASKLCSPQ